MVQVVQNLTVPKAPQHVTTLARFSTLQYLSITGLEGLQPSEVCLVLLQAPQWVGSQVQHISDRNHTEQLTWLSRLLWLLTK